MSCNEQPIRIFRGQRKTFDVVVRTAEGALFPLGGLFGELGGGGAPNWEIFFTVATQEGEEPTIEKTLSNGDIAFAGDTGERVRITVLSADTADIEAANFFQRYDVVAVINGERVQLVEPSDFEIVPVVTLVPEIVELP